MLNASVDVIASCWGLKLKINRDFKVNLWGLDFLIGWRFNANWFYLTVSFTRHRRSLLRESIGAIHPSYIPYI